MDLGDALRIGSSTDRNSSSHHLLFRAHLVLFPSYYFHCNSSSHGHSLSLLHADADEPFPTPVANSLSFSWLITWVAKALVVITHFANTAFHLTSLAPGASIDGIHLPLPILFIIYAALGLVYAGWIKMKRIRNKMARSQEDFSPENALFTNWIDNAQKNSRIVGRIPQKASPYQFSFINPTSSSS